MRAEASAGLPEPIGATLTEGGANFAYPAPDATALYVCVFEGPHEVARIRLPGRTGDVHHGLVHGIAEGARYGLRAEGPWEPRRGHRFNPAKLLLDPWARQLDRAFGLDAALFDAGDLPDGADSAAHVPKAVLTPALPAATRRAPRGPQVIYELHVKGFTARHPRVPEAIRGTFTGLAHPDAIGHLVALGVTAVEIMPCAAWVDERHLPPLGLTNYWGYNPAGLLCPDPRLAPGGMPEVRAAVAALHAAGIAVILDVVLNHTGEGDHLGPTLSLRGLGNAAYYRLRPDNPARYADDAGCGNTLALDRPWPLRLAMDALRHWAVEAGVDGFRLDLATTLGRRDDGFDADAPLILAMRQDPVLRDLLIIAEPWDIGPGGYRLGEFSPGWGEWNDRFRDDVRRFWRGDRGMVGALATRLAGSSDAFSGRQATDSVNFVAAHDGFTLADLVSFTVKRNHANGEENRDGTEANHSWNNGAEGPTDDPDVLRRRRADLRALLATLLCARGTPMLGMGDECGRSAGGNNNAYAQDNATSWFDWDGMDAGLLAFARRLIAARRAHPALHDAARLTGAGDVEWLRPDGAAMRDADWHDEECRALVVVLAARGDRCAVALNAGREAVRLALPPARAGHSWRLVADSAAPEREGEVPGELPTRAVLLLAEQRRGAAQGDPAMLARLAQAAGIATSWHEISGRRHEVPEETIRALLDALRLPARSDGDVRESLEQLSVARALPASLTGNAEEVAVSLPLGGGNLHLRLESGEERVVVVGESDGEVVRAVRPNGHAVAHRFVRLRGLPEGRHVLRLEDSPDEACHLLVAPRRAFLPDDLRGGARRFGLAAQLYALRREDDQGIGDFTALAELARLAQREGAALLGLSPPHALFPADRSRASPYHPSDRRFLDPIFLDVASLPLVGGLPAVRAALDRQAGVFAALSARGAVDHGAVWTSKLAVLEAAWRSAPDAVRARVAEYRAAGGEALHGFCAFTAKTGGDEGFEAFQQMLADMQLGEAGRAGAGLYRDLAVGAAPDGAEVWSDPEGFVAGFSVGAPPDPFSAEGQVWGLPPPDPRRSAETGHAAFAALIRANMRHAAALRIDHVLGLRRLFVVPHGAKGAEGAYLAYPFGDLLGQLALESQRARCLVVGEDLGTVPEGIGQALQSADVLSYRVLWFEREGDGFVPPGRWPARAASCVSTHDLPTLAGFWSGADLRERAALGLLADLDGALAERERDRAALVRLLLAEGLLAEGDGPLDDALAAAVHALVARTPSALVLAQVEDLLGQEVAVNLPGTDRERPNWRARMPVGVGEIARLERARAILSALAAERPPPP